MGVVSVPGLNGTRTRKFYYGKTRDEASAKLNKALGDLERGIFPVMNERTDVETYLASWLEDTVKPNHRPATYTSYEGLVRVHIVPVLGNIQLTKLTPSHVRRLMAEMAAKTRQVKSRPAPPSADGGPADVASSEPETRPLCSPRTIQYARSVLGMALNQAVSDGLIPRNVARLTPGPKVERREIRPLSPQQVGAFLAGTKNDRLAALWVVAFTMGLRKSEILGLRWPNVDLTKGELRVSETLSPTPGISFGAPKSERSRRTLVLPAVTVKALKSHKARQNSERLELGPDWPDYDFVFTTPIGTPLDHRNVNRYFDAHLTRLSLPRQRFQDARHACATFLLSSGVQLRVVQEILGHSQIGITADIYAHVTAALQKDAMRHIDRAFARI